MMTFKFIKNKKNQMNWRWQARLNENDKRK